MRVSLYLRKENKELMIIWSISISNLNNKKRISNNEGEGYDYTGSSKVCAFTGKLILRNLFYVMGCAEFFFEVLTLFWWQNRINIEKYPLDALKNCGRIMKVFKYNDSKQKKLSSIWFHLKKFP